MSAVLGVSAHYHDSAAALLVDGLPVAAVQEERLSRARTTPRFPAGRDRLPRARRASRAGDLDAVVFYENPMPSSSASSSRSCARGRAPPPVPAGHDEQLGEKLWVKGLVEALGVPRAA